MSLIKDKNSFLLGDIIENFDLCVNKKGQVNPKLSPKGVSFLTLIHKDPYTFTFRCVKSLIGLNQI